jgi:hypothetical protein
VPAEKSKTGLIILGASEFPLSNNFQSSNAFLEAKTRIKKYFTDLDGLALDKTFILDLFNSDEGADPTDIAIGDFIGRLRQQNVMDLFIYYVGHGSFSPGDRGFFFAIKKTRDDSLSVSSITLRSLAGKISRLAVDLRTYFIIDCCFSAQAGIGFMADTNNIIGQQVLEEYPTKGVTLLCSSSKDLPSLIIEERNVTMFSESFEMALRKGDSSISQKFLSLKELHKLTHSYIKQLNPGKDIRPEIISPIQPTGDIAEIRQFYNYGYKDSKADIIAKKREIENEMIRNNVLAMCNLFIDFVRNFDIQGQYEDAIVDLGSQCYDLEEEKSSMEKEAYKVKRNKLYAIIREITKAIINQPGKNLNARDN